MNATLSIRGLFYWDNTIFDDMSLPEGVDRDTLKANILLEASELEVLIPDPSIMKDSINYWATTRLSAWTRIQEALTAEYNPLWNKDGTVEETTKSKGTSKSAGESDTLGKVAGMNENTLNNSQATEGKTSAEGTSTGEVEFTRHEYGNIGVTTSQQMLREELDLRREANIYELITREFIDKFCLLVY